MKWLEIILGMCLALAVIACAGCSDDMQGKRSGEPKTPKYLTLDLGKGVTMKLVLIPAGKFLMGSPQTETEREDDEDPQHEVTISKPFYMGIYEVTQAQWRAVMDSEPWEGKKYVKSGPGNAASRISWDNASKYCQILSKKTGKKIALPTEAQWEYACRAGSKTAYYFGDDASKLGDYAWYKKNASDKNEWYPHATGQKIPNSWGLYDMHGNVAEWCCDRYDGEFYARAENVDPENTTKGEFRVVRLGPLRAKSYYRVVRGGEFGSKSYFCRAANRYAFVTFSGISGNGFRVVVATGSGVD